MPVFEYLSRHYHVIPKNVWSNSTWFWLTQAEGSLHYNTVLWGFSQYVWNTQVHSDTSRRYRFSGIKQGNQFHQVQNPLSFVMWTGRSRVIYSYKQTAKKLASPKTLSQAAACYTCVLLWSSWWVVSCLYRELLLSRAPCYKHCLLVGSHLFTWGEVLHVKWLSLDAHEGRDQWPLGRLIPISNACDHLQRVLFPLITGCLLFVFTKHISVEKRQLEFL